MIPNDAYHEMACPSAAEHFLPRPAVVKSFEKAFKKPLTTVVAGAGYGKTQAVLEAINALECKSAWMQLSELDNHITRFWERVAYSFHPQSPSLCESLLSLGYPDTIALFDQFLRLIERELTHGGRFIFVIDDFHLINNAIILNFIGLFISACIHNFSIVIISRKKPDLSLAGMLSKGLLARITEKELRFSKEDMAAYYRKKDISFSEKLISEIYAYTDGWIFAICLVGLAVQKKNGATGLNPVLDAKIDIFDLIEREIFNPASKALQLFLIKISVLDDMMPSGLLKKLAGDNPSLLSEMMQISLFIQYDSLYDGYYIHHLFKDFLREKKHLLDPDELTSIHFTAAKWYEKHGQKSEAIDQYEQCGHYIEILDIIISYSNRVTKEDADSFIQLIEQAPQEAIEARPIVRVAKARYLFNNNKIEQAQRELFAIKEEYEALPKTEENQAILGEAYIVLALISVVQLDYEFETFFKMADACLPEGSILYNKNISLADGINVCSIKEFSSGELKRHQDAIFRTAPYVNRVMNGCGYGLEYLNAAESSLYQADLKTAEKYAYETIFRARQYQQYDTEYMANFVLVRIFAARGNFKAISEILNQLKARLEDIQVAYCISLYDIISGWFHMKIRKTGQVAKWIKYEEETRKILAPVVLGREYLVRSDCLLAEGRYYELLAFMNQTDKMYEQRGILYAIIQNYITKAITYHYMGSYAQSLDMLNKAYELTHPNKLVMQYIEYGKQMRTVILAAKQNENCSIPKDWLDMIYTKSSTYAKQITVLKSAYEMVHSSEATDMPKLSTREREVLECLCRGMKRNEIAASCYLSLSTINSVIKNIYNKLGAYNVVDAVRITKEKDLL